MRSIQALICARIAKSSHRKVCTGICFCKAPERDFAMAEFIRCFNEIVWGKGLLCLLLGTGVWLMVRLRFLPLRKLPFALSCIFSERNGKVSPYAALTAELAATIGTGNIVGVATAMVLGGPGALLWMMIAAVFGMATKLVESTLSVKYRIQNRDGSWRGGPMYVLRDSIGRRGSSLRSFGGMCAGLYGVFAALAAFGMGNMVQSNAIAEALQVSFGIGRAKCGLVLALFTILIIVGGIGSIVRLTQFLVPFMGAFYLIGVLGILVMYRGCFFESLILMIRMAFSPECAIGGVCGGFTRSACIRYGVSRGVFSNEAGLGAGGITAASADTGDYIRQGYISMTGVFIDTIVICCLTGIAFACSGCVGMQDDRGVCLNGTRLTIAIFRKAYGDFGETFVSISIALFALATIIAWAYQGEKAVEFLTGSEKSCLYYRGLYAAMTFLGAVCSLEAVWNFSDLCNGLMAFPNLFAVLYHSMHRGGICEEIIKYSKAKPG